MSYPGTPPRLRESDADSMARRMALFDVEAPRRRLEDLIVPEATIGQLRALLTKIRHHHVLYDDRS